MDFLQLGSYTFSSRLILGTGKFSSSTVMLEAVKASGAQLVTVALRRFNREQLADDLGLFAGSAETREHFHRHREGRQAPLRLV